MCREGGVCVPCQVPVGEGYMCVSGWRGGWVTSTRWQRPEWPWSAVLPGAGSADGSGWGEQRKRGGCSRAKCMGSAWRPQRRRLGFGELGLVRCSLRDPGARRMCFRICVGMPLFECARLHLGGRRSRACFLSIWCVLEFGAPRRCLLLAQVRARHVRIIVRAIH